MALTKLNARSASALDATILTGALPAISGASLTGITTGKILQVTNGDYSTQHNNSTDDLADIGVSAAITPSATSSKIFITADTQYSLTDSSSTTFMGGINLFADIGGGGYNKISGGGSFGEYYACGFSSAATAVERRISGRWTACMVWSPSTTSACTVKIYSHNNASNSLSCTYDSITTHINLMEIGA